MPKIFRYFEDGLRGQQTSGYRWVLDEHIERHDCWCCPKEEVRQDGVIYHHRDVYRNVKIH